MSPGQAELLRLQDEVKALLRAGLLLRESADADLDATYRRLALEYHPDRGGSHDAFLSLQQVYEWERVMRKIVAS
jgi:hypothetical protein